MNFRQEDLPKLLDELISNWENEVVEFKIGNRNTSSDEIGRYFSALSNEANLRGAERAWLVFGVDNKTHGRPGSEYPCDANSLNKSGGLKAQIAEGTNLGMCFAGVHLLPAGERTHIVFFEIPAAPLGMPVAWKGHFYARAGENVTALGMEKIDAIRRQCQKRDWTAQVVDDATVDDLDEQAIDFARRRYADKHARSVSLEEVESWPLTTFLDRARLTQSGRITRAALLLLGREQSAYKLSPYMAQLVWKLVGEEQANEIFRPPWLLATSALYARIRNVQIRMVVKGTLSQIEVPKYSDRMVLEALHNCIAHQDYSLNGRVIVTEHVDRLVLENRGTFFYGKPEDYLAGEKTPPEYRNPQLVEAMSELNMIDTMGYGIHRMFADQAKRYMPLHDYEVTPASVKVTIYGRILDEKYSSLLVKCPNLPIDQVVLLDRVQKGLRVSSAAIAGLRRAGLVEGRMPHLHISADVAEATGQEAEYMRKKERTGAYYQRLIIDYLEKFPGSQRKKINEFMLDEIRGDFTSEEKIAKITHLLTVMRRNHVIENRGTDKNPRWFYIDEPKDGVASQCKSQCKPQIESEVAT